MKMKYDASCMTDVGCLIKFYSETLILDLVDSVRAKSNGAEKRSP